MDDLSRQYVASQPDDLLRPDKLAKMSGLEFLTGMMNGALPGPPIAGIMGMRLLRVEEGHVVFEGTPAFAHYNPIGSVHGGWFGTMLDSCMACAIQSTQPAGRGYTTLEYRVNILRPVFETTGALRAAGTVRHVGRRTGVAEGQIEDEGGRLYATGSTTCMMLDLG